MESTYLGFGVRETWVQILMYILKNHMTMGLLFNLPAPEFPIQENRDNSYLVKMLQVFPEMIHAYSFLQIQYVIMYEKCHYCSYPQGEKRLSVKYGMIP